jgi:hypothetical protein
MLLIILPKFIMLFTNYVAVINELHICMDESALRGVVLQRQASGNSNICCSMSLKQHVFNKIGIPSFAVFLGLSLHTSCVYIYSQPKNDNKIGPNYKISSECSLSQNHKKHYYDIFS